MLGSSSVRLTDKYLLKFLESLDRAMPKYLLKNNASGSIRYGSRPLLSKNCCRSNNHFERMVMGHCDFKFSKVQETLNCWIFMYIPRAQIWDLGY